MLCLYGCGYNGFHQLEGFDLADKVSREDQTPPQSHEEVKFEQKILKPKLLCRLEKVSVEDVKMTWSRMVVTLRKENKCYSTALSGYCFSDQISGEGMTRECVMLDNLTCTAATDADLLFETVTSPTETMILKDLSKAVQKLCLSQNPDVSSKIDLNCVSGGHDKFHCIYDGVSFGQFSCSLGDKKSESVSNTLNGNEQKCSSIPLIVHHIDCIVPIKEISCGKEHVLLLAMSGTVYSFGLSSRGQLGHGDVEKEEVPRLIEDLEGMPVRSVAAGGWHSVAVSEIGDAYVWGWNESGQLGLSAVGSGKSGAQDSDVVGIQSVPACLDVPGDFNVKATVCGARHTVLLTEEGDVFTCGWNGYGQLGLRHTESVGKLTKVNDLPGKCSQIFAGQWNSVFVCHH